MCFKAIKEWWIGHKQEQEVKDVPSPKGRIKPEDVKWDSETGLLTIKLPWKEVWLAGAGDTKSMDPTIDSNTINIMKKIEDYVDLIPGDICVYYTPMTPQGVIHRIKKIEEDEEGRLYTFKRDNQPKDDPWVLRDAHVQYVLAGILYVEVKE